MAPDPVPAAAPGASDRLPQPVLTALARAGIARGDVDDMLASWRWRATWGATLGAMAASAAMRVFVYAGEDRGPGEQLTASVRWVILVVFMLLGGMLGDLFGRRRLLIGCLAGVTVAAVLATFSSSVPSTLFVLQLVIGLFGAMALPLTLAVVRTSLQPRMLGIGVLVYMTGYAAGFALPKVGSLLALWLGAGYDLVPLILAAGIGLDAVSAHAPLDRPIRVHQGDIVSLALFVVAMGAIALGIQHAAAEETSSLVSIALVASGFAVVGVFFWWQGRQPDPALDTQRFRERWFLSALLAGAAVSFSLQFSWRAVVALLVVLVGHATLHELVVLVVAAAVGALVGAGTSALGSSRANGGHLIAAGLGAIGVGLLGVVLVFALRPSVLWLLLPIALVTGGIVLGNMLRTLVIVAGVPARSAGTASGLLNGVGYLGGMLAPLLFRPLVLGPTYQTLAAGLAGLGLTPAQLADSAASILDATVTAIKSAAAGQPVTVGATGAVLQRSLAQGLAVALVIVGISVAVIAAAVWRSWRGHDTPLYDSATGKPRTFDDLGEAPEPLPAPGPEASAR
jgi:hypothetical protein